MKSTFSERVLRAALSIPEGRVTTYGRIARASGGGAFSSQSITSILSKVKNVPNIPYHRIVYADGRIWMKQCVDTVSSGPSLNSERPLLSETKQVVGGLDPKHYKERMKLYKKEGIEITKDNKVKNFNDILFEFE